MDWFRRIVFAILFLIALLLTIWSAAALYFDSPFPALRAPAAVVYLIVVLGALLFLRSGHKGTLVAFAGFALVALWWFTLKPSGNRNWQPDNAQTASADIDGDHITIHNVRNCSYVTEKDYTCQWETRSYDLANLSGADLFITWWGPTLIAHPIVSFDFGPHGHVPFSIETRDVVGQSYSAIRGFFRQYELAYIVSDERDVVRLRTNFRKDEEVYLFRTTVKPEFARKIFLDYLQRVNELHNKPEWYNAVTNNCTTNIDVSASQAQDKRTVWDWRVLLNGKMDEMLYEHHRLVTGGLSLPALKAQAHINEAAKAADDSPQWSELIRVGRVGFTPQTSGTPTAP
ncbi:MAG: DUF4105 domain-containing protein [Candidatus Korobacteraceae bacterium]